MELSLVSKEENATCQSIPPNEICDQRTRKEMWKVEGLQILKGGNSGVNKGRQRSWSQGGEMTWTT